MSQGGSCGRSQLEISTGSSPPISSHPQVPPAPVNKDDFALVQRPGPGLTQEAARRYGELTKLLRQQHEVRSFLISHCPWGPARCLLPGLTARCPLPAARRCV